MRRGANGRDGKAGVSMITGAVVRIPTVPPGSTSLLANWLARNPEFEGIGVSTARKLARTFGGDLHAVLSAGDPQPFIPIIGGELASNLVAVYREKLAEADTIAWLDANGFDTRLAFRMVRIWGEGVVPVSRQIHTSCSAFSGWKQVDAAALRMGIQANDERRLIGAVEAALYMRLDQKHTFTDVNSVVDAVHCLLKAPRPVARQAVEKALQDHAVVGDGGGLQPVGAAVMERFLANRIRILRSSLPSNLFRASASDEDIRFVLSQFELAEGRPLTSEQRQAVQMAVREPVGIITGGAGVGKTTVLKALCMFLERMSCQVLPIALAGRAAKRISELTGRKAMTIAAFLQGVKSATLKIGFDALVVVDEASMLDLATLYRLARSAPDHVRFLFVGDPYQLPPIGFGLTFHLWADAQTLPTVRLTRIHRQSEATGIPLVAEKIREGRIPILSGYKRLADGVSFIEMPVERIIDVLPAIVSDLGIDGCQNHFSAQARDRSCREHQRLFPPPARTGKIVCRLRPRRRRRADHMDAQRLAAWLHERLDWSCTACGYSRQLGQR